MNKLLLPLIFVVFFISGFCALLYQVVWLRLAFASFGVITPVMSVVVSMFMFGIFLGSWVGGRLGGKFTSPGKSTAIYIYAAAEAVIGVSGFVVPGLFKKGAEVLINTGDMNSFSYLGYSAVLLGLILIPWCTAMGTTFPLMMAFVRSMGGGTGGRSFSFLYLGNVIGAIFGTLMSAYVLVETFGLHRTLWIAAGLNFFVAALCICIGMLSRPFSQSQGSRENNAAAKSASTLLDTPSMALTILFATGFASMALEVIWVRGFTPVLSTVVYSFARLLFMYLFATAIGTAVYRHFSKAISTTVLMNLLIVSTVFSGITNDPRFALGMWATLLTIFPFSAILGYLTPKLIDEYSRGGEPERAGWAYAVNVMGCIIGPLFASYILLPVLGVKLSVLLLSLPFFAIAFRDRSLLRSKSGMALIGAACVGLLIGVFYSRSNEEKFAFEQKHELFRDHSATVIAVGEGMEKRLVVNGINITGLTPITKMMAHVPLAMLDYKPKSALAICLGMGTTFRSLATWDIDAKVVELVPSVLKTLPYFFPDLQERIAHKNAQIVVDDGRRFLNRTAEKFDVITIDPPPPIEAAYSSLLYSKEFYDAIKRRLSDRGILQQWFPYGEKKVLAAIYQSLHESFPHLRYYRSVEGGGVHFFASFHEIPEPSVPTLLSRMPEAALKDMVEWNPETTPSVMLSKMFSSPVPVSEMQVEGFDLSISDDRPYNEYYALRNKIAGMGPTGQKISAYILSMLGVSSKL